MEYWFRGQLELRDATAIRDAAQFLEDEGYVGHEDNVLGDEELRWAGNVLTVHSRGSMPHASFEICSDVLRLWAQYARDGDVVALNVEDGLGERYLAGNGEAAGGACIELGADEVAALRLAYGPARRWLEASEVVSVLTGASSPRRSGRQELDCGAVWASVRV